MSDSEDPILTSTITLQYRSWWFATIDLYRDRIELRGWTWNGRVSDCIPARKIILAEMWKASHGPNLRLRMEARPLTVLGRLHMGVKFWELALERHEGIDFKLRH